jgi:dephospho-CoA kinase
VRLERLVQERQLPEADAMAMIAAQMPADLKRARADHVIDNDGTLGKLETKVREVWSALQQDERARETAKVS